MLFSWQWYVAKNRQGILIPNERIIPQVDSLFAALKLNYVRVGDNALRFCAPKDKIYNEEFFVFLDFLYQSIRLFHPGDAVELFIDDNSNLNVTAPIDFFELLFEIVIASNPLLNLN